MFFPCMSIPVPKLTSYTYYTLQFLEHRMLANYLIDTHTHTHTHTRTQKKKLTFFVQLNFEQVKLRFGDSI